MSNTNIDESPFENKISLHYVNSDGMYLHRNFFIHTVLQLFKISEVEFDKTVIDIEWNIALACMRRHVSTIDHDNGRDNKKVYINTYHSPGFDILSDIDFYSKVLTDVLVETDQPVKNVKVDWIVFQDKSFKDNKTRLFLQNFLARYFPFHFNTILDDQLIPISEHFANYIYENGLKDVVDKFVNLSVNLGTTHRSFK